MNDNWKFPLGIALIVLLGVACSVSTATPAPQNTPAPVSTSAQDAPSVSNLAKNELKIQRSFCFVSAVRFLNFRANYGTSQKVVEVLSNSEKLEITGKSHGIWIEVVYKGKTGWVNSNFCEKK